jgi:hypothetical protein
MIPVLVAGTLLADVAWLAADPFPLGTYRDGGFLASFTQDGRLTVRGEGFVKARANYSVKGDEIEIVDEVGSACEQAGKYKWAFDGRVMRFTKIADACQGRVHHLTSRPWPAEKLESPAK